MSSVHEYLQLYLRESLQNIVEDLRKPLLGLKMSKYSVSSQVLDEPLCLRIEYFGAFWNVPSKYFTNTQTRARLKTSVGNYK